MFQLFVMWVLCNTSARHDIFCPLEQGTWSDLNIFLMYSPSWPWQISVVPVVPSTNTAFSLISFRDWARGGQCEHNMMKHHKLFFMTQHGVSTSWLNLTIKDKNVVTECSSIPVNVEIPFLFAALRSKY